jgi:hypothetical protein
MTGLPLADKANVEPRTAVFLTLERETHYVLNEFLLRPAPVLRPPPPKTLTPWKNWIIAIGDHLGILLACSRPLLALTGL